MTRSTYRFAGTLLLTLALATGAAANDEEVLFAGTWTAGGYEIDGSWSIVESDEGRFVVLDEDFRTRRAPDLKLFLSPLELDEVGDGNATDGALLIAPLESPRGAQRYALDDAVELADYRSLLIHCQRFSKYWGGAELAETQ